MLLQSLTFYQQSASAAGGVTELKAEAVAVELAIPTNYLITIVFR
jgi:hypothetical protein